MTSITRFLDQYGNERKPSRHFGTVAFWVKNTTVIEVDTRHVYHIIDHPERFGLTERSVQDEYERSGERLRSEGKARDNLIGLAVRNGWIRVRHYVDRNRDYWSIQVDHYETRAPAIQAFIMWAVEQGYMYPDDEVRITDENDYRSGPSRELFDPLT